MAWFLCAYRPWPKQWPNIKSPVGSYASFIWAKDLAAAKKIAAKRRIGERIILERGNRGRPFTPPSVQLRKRRLTPEQKLDVIHGAIFLAFLFQRTKKATAHNTLGDEGGLHLLVHHFTTGWPRKRRIVRILEIYERAVPGYWPQPKRGARGTPKRTPAPKR